MIAESVSGKGYKKLIVWQKADDLAFEIYQATKKFPKEEIFGIVTQLRRSAVSVPTNIAEGMGRQNRNESKQFVNIALGSLAETEYLMEFSLRLKYLTEEDYTKIEALRSTTGAMLWSLHKSFNGFKY